MKRTDVPVIEPFNPLDKKHLGESLTRALLESEVSSLPPTSFIGAGVYALYYTGSFPAYEILSAVNQDEQFLCPIYVGKAVPAGARKGGTGTEGDQGFALKNRLRDHVDSISAVNNLDTNDFYCRFLVVDDIWIPLTEALLIEKYKPVWNRVLDGFGNHDPGGGRHRGKMPQWDCLHPGRSWTRNLQPCTFSPQELELRVRTYLEEALL